MDVFPDIVDRTEEARWRRDAILEAVAFAGQRFLTASCWEEAIGEVLARLGEATGVSRVYIFESGAEDGEIVVFQRHEWAAPGIVPQIDSPDLQCVPVDAVGARPWIDALRENQPVHALVRDIPEPLRSMLAEQDIRSLALVPLFAESEWWGFIGFDECLVEREWTQPELDGLKVAAAALGAAIVRERTEGALRRRDAILEAVRFAAERFLAASWEAVLPETLARLGEAAGVSRAYLFQVRTREDGATVADQRAEWAAPGNFPDDHPDWQGFCYRDRGFSEWEASLRRGDAIRYQSRDFTEEQRAFLEAHGVLTTAEAPIFVGGEWWGIIGFDECEREREWTAPELDGLKAAAGVLGAAIAREEAERELAEARAKYQALVEQVPAVVYVAEFGPEGEWLYVSPQIEQMLGITPEEWVSHPHPFRSLVHPEDLERVLDAEERALAEGDAVRAEYRIRARDGRWLWILDEAVVVRDEDARPVYMQGLMYDISERRRTEERLQRSYEALRRADRERRQLIHRLVEAQEEERSRIAEDVHDDPLQKVTAVAIRLGTLRGKLEDPELRADVERLEGTVGASIERLRHLMFELRPPSLDRGGLVVALRQYLEDLAQEAGMSFDVEDALGIEPPPETRAIAYRIAQEALANVRKHARAGRVEVALRDQGQGVHVRIRDDGSGFVPSEAVEHTPGHLGLASMRDRAEMAGGWWRLSSAPGEGTEVEFWLPVAEAPPGPQA